MLHRDFMKVGCGKESKKLRILLCFSLTLHYLCRYAAKIGCTSGKKINLTIFFAFHSVCTIFAVERHKNNKNQST